MKKAETSLLPASLDPSTVALAERLCSSSSMALVRGGVFDAISKQLRNIGFDWRPNHKSDMVKTVVGHLQTRSASFIRNSVTSQDNFIALVYTIMPNNDTASMDFKGEQLRYVQNGPQFWTTLILPEERQMILEAPANIQQLQRDVFTGILDIAEEIGCDVVYGTVKKDNPDMKDMIRMFMYVGFSIVPPSVKKVDGSVVLCYEL